MNVRHLFGRFIIACNAALPMLAHAHHAMAGATPATGLEGLISGLAHPVIGLDHLLFVLAIGGACYYFGQRTASITAFLLGTIAGTVMHLFKETLPFPDAWVALSLVVLGVLLLRVAPFLRSKAAAGLVALCGVAHGYAYGEAIVGAEQTPLFAYLAGFTLVQLVIVLGGYTLARHADSARTAVKAVGGVLSIAGAAFLVMSFAG